MKIKTIVGLMLLAGTFSGQSYAVETQNGLDRSYQYLGLGVSRGSTDDMDYSLNEITLSVGNLLTENLYYSMDLRTMEDNKGDSNITTSTFAVDFGFRNQFTDSAEIYGDIGWDFALVDTLGGGQDEVTNVNLELGTQYLVADHFVAGVHMGYVLPEDADNYVSWGVKGTFYISEMFSYSLGYDKHDEFSAYNATFNLHY